MKNEISFSTLWKVFTKSWKIIVILVIAAMLVMGLVTNYVMDKKYSSSVTFYVINMATDSEYVTTSLMQVIEHLSNTYIEIIKSDRMLEPLCDILINEYSIEYTPDQIRSMMKASVPADTSTFSLKITNTDKNHAYVIAQLIANEAPVVIKSVISEKPTTEESENVEDTQSVVEMEKMRVLNNPKLDTSPDSPNLTANLILAALATAFAVYLICFIRYLTNTVVTSEEDVADIISKYPRLGSIPRWE